jgi:hypothetical protein
VKVFSRWPKQLVCNLPLQSAGKSMRFPIADVWLISAGTNSRVAKFFGEIVRTNPDPTRPIHMIVSEM